MRSPSRPSSQVSCKQRWGAFATGAMPTIARTPTARWVAPRRTASPPGGRRRQLHSAAPARAPRQTRRPAPLQRQRPPARAPGSLRNLALRLRPECWRSLRRTRSSRLRCSASRRRGAAARHEPTSPHPTLLTNPAARHRCGCAEPARWPTFAAGPAFQPAPCTERSAVCPCLACSSSCSVCTAPVAHC